MRKITSFFKMSMLSVTCGYAFMLSADNQTATVSPVLPGSDLPFTITIQQAAFSLPNGLQTFAHAVYDGKWVLITGRTNGLHGFTSTNDNFPPSAQNTVAYIVDPIAQTVVSRSLSDPGSGLTQAQIDYLSVTAPQYHQTKDRLYISGGYGVDSSNGLFSTKPVLTAIDLAGFINWVESPLSSGTASQYIRQLLNGNFRVTGGYMYQYGDNPALLIFGQNFLGYYTDNGNGDYTRQVRRFKIHDDGKVLTVKMLSPKPKIPDPSYRRRDLNIVPVLKKEKHGVKPGYVALSGVFTPGDNGGAWTVPVEISFKGKPSMANPASDSTFKQAMNNYNSACAGLFSYKTGDMYTILFGGITYGYFSDGVFQTDSELPFTNQVTTIQIDPKGVYSQYLMDGTFPVILSTGSNAGNQLLFGAGAAFIPNQALKRYFNDVINLDKITAPVVIGYIVGGIQSTLANTNFITDSAASPYIFEVVLTPNL